MTISGRSSKFEKAEKVMLEEACETAIHKAGLKENVGFFLAGFNNKLSPVAL